ncbi:MAG: protein-glutamate O-methyltransferase CheR [Candidatus Melainabacteria bacterium]|nr:protein-glutamate O-methyltransferase CheR [Candidatus Melainabacteria bacterium]
MTQSPDQFDDEFLMQFIAELHSRSGYDFRHYSLTSIRRRISRILQVQKFSDLSELKTWVYSCSDAEHEFIESLSVPTTSMFRDPEVFKIIRTAVLPMLKHLPLLRVWSAGCSTGEEAYALAIMLDEEGLYDRSRIYVTDINEGFIGRARAGIFPMRLMKEYTTNYMESGGCHDFSSYFETGYDRIVFNGRLKSNMVFAHHNLVSDSSFNEFGLILCRNVLIYFGTPLQGRVLNLLDDSLRVDGYLILGEKESLRMSTIGGGYEQLQRPYKVFRKTAPGLSQT